MHEIEIKARVRDREKVLVALSARGCAFSEPISQEDIIYGKEVGSVGVFVTNTLFLRIRVQGNGKVIFTLKYEEGRIAHNPLSAPEEHELEVGSKEEMEKIIALLGFQEAVRVKKSRSKARYKKADGKEWEFCLDEVEGLGTFLEVEQMASLEEAEEVQKEMIDLLLSLGINKDDMPAQRYDIALMER